MLFNNKLLFSNIDFIDIFNVLSGIMLFVGFVGVIVIYKFLDLKNKDLNEQIVLSETPGNSPTPSGPEGGPGAPAGGDDDPDPDEDPDKKK